MSYPPLSSFPLPPPSSGGVHFAIAFDPLTSVAALEAGGLRSPFQLVGWSHNIAKNLTPISRPKVFQSLPQASHSVLLINIGPFIRMESGLRSSIDSRHLDLEINQV